MICAVVYLTGVYLAYGSGLLGFLHQMQGGARRDPPGF